MLFLIGLEEHFATRELQRLRARAPLPRCRPDRRYGQGRRPVAAAGSFALVLEVCRPGAPGMTSIDRSDSCLRGSILSEVIGMPLKRVPFQIGAQPMKTYRGCGRASRYSRKLLLRIAGAPSQSKAGSGLSHWLNTLDALQRRSALTGSPARSSRFRVVVMVRRSWWSARCVGRNANGAESGTEASGAIESRCRLIVDSRTCSSGNQTRVVYGRMWTPLRAASRCAMLAVSWTPGEERVVHPEIVPARDPCSPGPV